jgi:hypothetical protein
MIEQHHKTRDTVAQTELRPGAVGLSTVFMQSITSIGPA